jgi:single-strand DNA-binding protein
MNKVILVGRLTKDPELKRTNSDIPVVQFTVAVNRTYQSKNGEKQADFINCVVWRQQAENFAKYMRKGSLVGIDGQIQTRNFDDNNGVKRFVTEVLCDQIHFLESKSARNDNVSGFSDINQYDIPETNTRTSEKQKDPFEDLKSDFDVSNDDLPF